MPDQLELFHPSERGAHVIEAPVVGRITFAPSVAMNSILPKPAAEPSPSKKLSLAEFAGECIKNSGGKMHAGNLATSKRLKSTLQFLANGEWRSTLEISCFTGSMAVHSDIQGLRSNGIAVKSKCSKGRIWRYRVTP